MSRRHPLPAMPDADIERFAGALAGPLSADDLTLLSEELSRRPAYSETRVLHSIIAKRLVHLHRTALMSREHFAQLRCGNPLCRRTLDVGRTAVSSIALGTPEDRVHTGGSSREPWLLLCSCGHYTQFEAQAG